LVSYGELMQQKLGMEQAKQQREMGQMQIAQQKQAMAKEAELKRISQEVEGDPVKMTARLRQVGMLKEAENIEKAMLERAKSDRENQKSRIEVARELNGLQLPEYQTALSALDKDETKFQDIHQATLANTAKNAQKFGMDTTKSDDPTGFQTPEQMRQWLQYKIDTAMSFDQKQKARELELKEREKGFKGFHVGQDQIAYQVDDSKGQARQIMGPDGKPFRAQIPAPIVLDNRNKAAMANDITQHPLYAQAKSISDMKQGLPMRQGKQAAELNQLIAKIREEEGKPAYDANQWTKVKRSNEYFTGNGKAAVALTSNDTLYGHADEVLEALQGAGLNDTRVLNTVNQWLARQTGQDAKYKDLKVASKVYGSELASMLGEKDAHEKIETQKLFDNVDSPASFVAAVRQSQKMAATRSAALANQYYRETGLDPVEAGILPDRVARGAVETVSARNYEWAKKYRKGGESNEQPEQPKGFQSKGGWTLKPPAGNPDIASRGKNERFPNAVWTKDGPDGPGWYEKHGGQIGRVE